MGGKRADCASLCVSRVVLCLHSVYTLSYTLSTLCLHSVYTLGCCVRLVVQGIRSSGVATSSVQLRLQLGPSEAGASGRSGRHWRRGRQRVKTTGSECQACQGMRAFFYKGVQAPVAKLGRPLVA